MKRKSHLNAWVRPQMQDQQNISNQQFEFPLTFSADKNQFISYVRRAMSDGAIMLNKMSSAVDRMDLDFGAVRGTKHVFSLNNLCVCVHASMKNGFFHPSGKL